MGSTPTISTIWRVSIIGNAAVLKTADTERYSRFESLALRQKLNTVDVNIGGENKRNIAKDSPPLGQMSLDRRMRTAPMAEGSLRYPLLIRND